MNGWIDPLRARIARISAGHYSDLAEISTAPEAVQALCADIDGLANAMAERDTLQKALTHEVHHRVKNNLQIVSSLLNMQATRIAHPAARDALGQTLARMDALALIHRLAYERDDRASAATIDTAKLLPDLCMQLRLSQTHRAQATIAWQVAALAVPLDSAVPLTLFAVEAITNAYAHAFADGGKGSITLRSRIVDQAADLKPRAFLQIDDDGIGFDCQAKPERPALGRMLMEGFAGQLAGKLTITSTVDAGTIVRLDYPLA